MAQTPSKVTVHCPSCGVEVEVAVQIAGVQRQADAVVVGFDPSKSRHVCRTQPYVDLTSQPQHPTQVTGR